MLENKVIGSKYQFEKRLGTGTFGSIYRGFNIRTKERVAIKVEPNDSDAQSLKNETRVYQYLNGSFGIPNVRWFGTDLNNHYLVIDLLGISLTKLLEEKKKLSLEEVLNIGFQSIDILKNIHEKGMVHRDIKPDNFLLNSNNDIEKLYLIDFGLCKTFIDPLSSRYIEMRKTRSLIGTANFASINAHQCNELSRRDDLESLGYVLIYLYFGYLPWTNNNLNYSREEIEKMKINLLDNLSQEIPGILLEFLRCVRNLDFKETPSYEKYKKLFV